MRKTYNDEKEDRTINNELSGEEMQLKTEISKHLTKIRENGFGMNKIKGNVRNHLVYISQKLDFSSQKEVKSFLMFYSGIIGNPNLPLFDNDPLKLIWRLWIQNPEFGQSFMNFTKKLKYPLIAKDFWNPLLFKLYTIAEGELQLYLSILSEIIEPKLINENNAAEIWKFISKCFGISFDQKWRNLSAVKAEVVLSKNCRQFFRWAKMLNTDLVSIPAADRDFSLYEKLIDWFGLIKEVNYNDSKEFEKFLNIMEKRVSVGIILQVGRKEFFRIFLLYRIIPERFISFRDTEGKIISAEHCEARVHLLECIFSDFNIPQVFLRKYFNLTDIEMEWFRHVIKGNNIYTAHGLPFQFTKRAAHLLMQVHLYLERVFLYGYRISEAMVFAQALSMNASPDMAAAITKSEISNDLKNMEFWKTVIDFFAKNNVPCMLINPLIDYINHRRSQDASKIFSMKGRTVQSMLRDMEAWHREMHHAEFNRSNKFVQWDPVPIKNYECMFMSEKYVIVQLVSNEELYLEGCSLHHCVFSYSQKCQSGSSSIWSLRKLVSSGVEERLLTIEMRDGKIVQVRGMCNRQPTNAEAMLLKRWAEKEKIYMDILRSA